MQIYVRTADDFVRPSEVGLLEVLVIKDFGGKRLGPITSLYIIVGDSK
jgi:hypothetical protein